MSNLKFGKAFRFPTGEHFIFVEKLPDDNDKKADAYKVLRVDDAGAVTGEAAVVIHKIADRVVPRTLKTKRLGELIKASVDATSPGPRTRPWSPLFIAAAKLEPTSNDDDGNNVNDNRVETTLTAWGFCNGGNLDRLIPLCAGKIELPEVFFWKCLSQLLQTLDFILHLHPRGIGHRGWRLRNVLLHWPDETGEIPDFHLEVASVTVPGPRERWGGKYRWADEFRGLKEVMKAFVFCHDREYVYQGGLPGLDGSDAALQHQTPTRPWRLFKVLLELEERAATSVLDYNRPLPDLKLLRHYVDTQLARQVAAYTATASRPATTTTSSSIRAKIQPTYSHSPKLYDTLEEGATDGLRGPWDVVAIDTDTMKLVDFEPPNQV
jgi:hypothetical protein